MHIKALGLSLLLFSPLATLQAETPKTAAVAQPEWKIPPTFQYANSELENQNRKVQFQIFADTEGKVVNANVVESSGVAALDQKVQAAVMQAEFLPYPTKFQVSQTFELNLKKEQKWLVQPQLAYSNNDLQGQNRRLTLELTRDQKGFIQSIKILQSTGLKHLDEKIIGQVKEARLDPKHNPEKSTLPLSLGSQFNQQQARKVELKDDMPAKEAAKIWRYFPSLSYSQDDLAGQTRHLSFSLSFNAQGDLAKSSMTQSSGNPQLDAKIYKQIRTALLYSNHGPVTLNVPLVLEAKATSKKP